jgi:hypothetical protein
MRLLLGFGFQLATVDHDSGVAPLAANADAPSPYLVVRDAVRGAAGGTVDDHRGSVAGRFGSPVGLSYRCVSKPD